MASVFRDVKFRPRMPARFFGEDRRCSAAGKYADGGKVNQL
jgi:hypothetical protein